MPSTSNTRPTQGARTKQLSCYAMARIRARLSYRDLRRQGFGNSTIAKADRGELSKNKHIADAYLKAIQYPGHAWPRHCPECCGTLTAHAAGCPEAIDAEHYQAQDQDREEWRISAAEDAALLTPEDP